MDILKSSNVERVLFDLYGAERTRELMRRLDEERHYELSTDELDRLQEVFAADWCDDDTAKGYIRKAFDAGYLMDPHTATCFKAYDTCRTRKLATIAYSTAEWTKFSPTIANALTGEVDAHDIDALKTIATQAETPIPARIQALFDKPVAQGGVVDKADIEDAVLSFI
ncbi:MAG: hypothetical protein P8014_07905 [Acidihalobacter sp.]|uniref:hypothetical protein n=1 Tax=Acidihalobacter sp. TaxID=1872108 RepID=UPI00307DB02F